MDFIIVTGMSGAGKSQAIDALEDMGFFCVDNVPPGLLGKFSELPAHSQGKITRVALVVDVRSHGMFSDFLTCLQELEEASNSFKMLFLDCDDKVLHARYKETRRRHPLLDSSPSLAAAIGEERAMLAPARNRADYLVDTSLLRANQLKQRVRELFSDERAKGMAVTCMSFGFKHGMPVDSDLVFDVRCLPNPFYEKELKDKIGTQEEVRSFVMGNDAATTLADKLLDMIDFLLPLYIQEGKSQLVVSMGCTGGHHRSVVFAELLANHLRQKNVDCSVVHRDVQR